MESYQQTRTYPGHAAAGTLVDPPSTSSPARDRISAAARDRISAAESWLSDSHAALDMLENRLDTILTPTPPGNDVNPAAPTPLQSHVVGRLQILNDGYAYLVRRMHTLAERIEL